MTTLTLTLTPPGIRYEGELVPLATTAALVRLKPGGGQAVSRGGAGAGRKAREARQAGLPACLRRAHAQGVSLAGPAWPSPTLPSRHPPPPLPPTAAAAAAQEVEALLPALLRCAPGAEFEGEGADLLRCALCGGGGPGQARLAGWRGLKCPASRHC